MSEDLKHLISLQTIDINADRLSGDLISIPAQVEALKNDLESRKGEIEIFKKSLADIQVKRKEKELDLDEAEQAIKKHQQELNKVKTNEAYQALLKQIEEAKAKKEHLEEDILGFMEEADVVNKSQKDKKQELQKEEELVAEKEKELQKIYEKTKEELEKVRSERAKKASEIPGSVLNLYEKIRAKRDGIAMSGSRGDSCGGCQIKLTAEVLNRLLQDKELVICESCSRILYLMDKK